MAVLTVEFRSEILEKSMKIKVIVNESAKPPYPTFYLLHGLSDDESAWTRQTSLERYAKEYSFLIVMPDGARSWYCDSKLGMYESYITRDLVRFVDKLFPTRKQAKYRAIGGLSMGGYGAMKLGLKFPKLFGSISSHSGAIGYMRWAEKVTDIKETPVILDGMDVQANDPYELALKVPEKIRPNIYFDCGRQDFLYEDNQSFDALLHKNCIPHTYNRFDGAHEWSYWDIHIQDALKFHASAMAL